MKNFFQKTFLINKLFYTFFACCFFNFYCCNTQSRVIEINYSGIVDPIEIDLILVNSSGEKIEEDCLNQVDKYLKFSTLFDVSCKKFQSESINAYKNHLRSHLRLIINVKKHGNTLVLEGRLENRMGKVFLNVSLRGSAHKFQKICGALCDHVYQSVTGEKSGIFNTKFYFIANKLPTMPLTLSKMHFSKTRFKTLSSGYYTFSPAVANDKVAYIALNKKIGKYFLVVRNNKSKKNVQYVMNSSVITPVFSPVDSNLVLLNSFDKKESYITILNIKTGAKKDFRSKFSDLSPYFSHDGQYVYFSSNRRGKSKYELYKMDISTGSVDAIMHNLDLSLSYQLPMPSPKGNLLACIKYYGGKYSLISVLNLHSGNEQEIWNSGNRYKFIESLSWSPDGEIFIAFTAQDFSGKNKLCIVNLLTKNVREFDLPFDVSQVVWVKSRY